MSVYLPLLSQITNFLGRRRVFPPFEGNTPVRGGRGESKAQLNTKLGHSLRRGLQGVKWTQKRHRGVMDGNDN